MAYALRTLSMDLVTLVATMGAWGYPVAGGVQETGVHNIAITHHGVIIG